MRLVNDADSRDSSPSRAASSRSRHSVFQRRLIVIAWPLLTWAASLRRTRATVSQIRSIDQPHQVRGRGLRWTEALRDRLRPGWLRIRRDEDSAA